MYTMYNRYMCNYYFMHNIRTMETADAMLVFNKYDEMVELIQRLALTIIIHHPLNDYF